MTTAPNTSRMPTYFISHGGGPWPWMDEQFGNMYDVLRRFLRELPDQLPEKPKAVLMVTAHWETDTPRVSTSEQPGMLYDYYNFPPHTYEVTYPAPGSPAVAQRVSELMQQADIDVQPDAQRDYDHGTFVPMAVMYPDADVPVVMLSIMLNRDPARHLAIGRALTALRDEGVLIIGSGLSYHNLRMLNQMGAEPSRQFDDWLQEALVSQRGEARSARLQQWSDAPGARIAHAEEDHLVPLFVAAGAAEEDPARCVHHETNAFGHITVSSFRFG